MFFLQINFHVLVIHELGVNLVRGRKLSDNRDPEQPMSSLWYSMESLRFCPVIQSLLPRLVRSGICFYPCVP